jgi:hypothetical protein
MPPEGKGLARSLGQPQDELDYLRATWPSHSTVLGILENYVTSHDGTTTYLLRKRDVARLLEIAGVAIDYYMRALAAAAAILDWPTIHEVETCRIDAAATLSKLEGEFQMSQP